MERHTGFDITVASECMGSGQPPWNFFPLALEKNLIFLAGFLAGG